MKAKILKTIEILKTEYNSGGYTSFEYNDLLIALNHTVFNMVKFLLVDDINAGEIQELIHKEQDLITF